MPHFSFPELLIVLLIVVVLFGAGRVSKLGGELGVAIREFRKGLEGDKKDKPEDESAKVETQAK
ncbi:MAG TPA: twin-arginine translocase TatA/TatE family subunit [Aggregatilineales bacterium]|nr:twin-arginine translocase TatA/TatE family subunit [Aggregatilineales bacterium]